MNCERCGRHLDRLEGRIGDLNYCHPDDPDLPDCYTLTSHEHTFGKVLETPEDLFVHIDQRLVELQAARWHDALEHLVQNDGPDKEFTESMCDKWQDFLDALSDPNTEVTFAEGGKVAKDVK